MKRLVLLGEGTGEVTGLPVLARKILEDKNISDCLFVDHDVIRAHNAEGLVRLDKKTNLIDCSSWLRYLAYGARRKEIGGILAVFDGDSKTFPAGTKTPFCAVTAAKTLASAAKDVGAGVTFSLAVVFACVEYETWIIAGIGESGIEDTSPLFPGKAFPGGDPESHGKGWLERNIGSYRPARDQKLLTEQLDLRVVRSRNLRSFKRLDNAFDQLFAAVVSQRHICTPM